MRGNFDELIGKTISDVYCRKNSRSPEAQIFLLFDDGTYYEIYADSSLKGAGGVDKGDLEYIKKYHHPVEDY